MTLVQPRFQPLLRVQIAEHPAAGWATTPWLSPQDGATRGANGLAGSASFIRPGSPEALPSAVGVAVAPALPAPGTWIRTQQSPGDPGASETWSDVWVGIVQATQRTHLGGENPRLETAVVQALEPLADLDACQILGGYSERDSAARWGWRHLPLNGEGLPASAALYPIGGNNTVIPSR